MATETPTSRGGDQEASDFYIATQQLRCICNLCECGNHRCSNFALAANSGELLRNSQANSSNDNNNNNNNRCQQRVNSMESARVGGKCQCIGEEDERYLTRPNSNASNRSASLNRADDIQAPAAQSGRPNRRHLASPSSPNAELDDELVHVLVSRPTVASRPRDNIMFEGDMDLKTTFETSYEALAKMRLDCWKKYQDNRSSTPLAGEAQVVGDASGGNIIGAENKRNSSSAANSYYNNNKSSSRRENKYYGILSDKYQDRASEKSSPSMDQVNDSRTDVSVDYYNKPVASVSHLVDGGADTFAFGGQSKLMATTNQNKNYHDQRTGVATPLGPPVRQHAAGLQSSSSEARTSRASTRTRSVAAQVVDEDLPQVQLDHNDKALDSARPSTRTVTRSPIDLASLPPAGTPSSRTTPVNGAPDYVDPDLAPIMVYDSNMNRLERVGLRKRSKYRPSTSLRPGARGLFGDQSLEESEAKVKQAVADKVGSNYQGTASMSSEQRRVQGAAGASPVNRFPEEEMDVFNQKLNRQTRQALDARNLGDSHQPKYLTFSQQNLPIDSKRKVKDNINMTDHIKEHNIVAGLHRNRNVSTSIDAGSPVAMSYISKQQRHQQANSEADSRVGEHSRHCAMTSGENVHIYGREDDLSAMDEINRMAEMEEAEAVAEIQRCTMPNGQSTLPEDNLIQQQTGVAPTTGVKNLRQEKLHKTCQQQNFHIFENEYPEARESTTKKVSRVNTMDSTSSPVTSPPTRMSYKNLFRESPDFIMTTGKFNDPKRTGGASEITNTQDQRKFKSIIESSDVQQEHGKNHDEIGRSPCDECRVLKLQDEFDFVEAKSGHKYFVPKTPSPVHNSR